MKKYIERKSKTQKLKMYFEKEFSEFRDMFWKSKFRNIWKKKEFKWFKVICQFYMVIFVV